MEEQSTGERIRALRAEAEERLVVPGARRIELLRELETLESDLRGLMLQANDAGVTFRRIGELVGLTSGGVSKWIERARQS